MAWILAKREEQSYLTTYKITTIATGGTNAAIKVEKTTSDRISTSLNIGYVEASSKVFDMGDILIDYGQTTSYKWTVKAKSGRIVSYNGTNYTNEIVYQWFYYTTIVGSLIMENNQQYIHPRNGYNYNIVTKTISSSNTVITVKYYYNTTLIQSIDISNITAQSSRQNVGNIDIYYLAQSSTSTYAWQIFPHTSSTIIESDGEYFTGSTNVLIKQWNFGNTVNFMLYECSS